MDAMIDRARTIGIEALNIWFAGGWAMIAIAAISLIMFGLGVHVLLDLSGRGFSSVREKTWRRWIHRPEERKGPIGDLIDGVLSADSVKSAAAFFDEMRQSEVAPFEKDLKVMKVCVSAAPLLGLLGTVTGMLTTFSALASGSGGEKTMQMVARGISEALVTTETGLVIALPGLFFHHQLSRKLGCYKAFLAHLESACLQALHRNLSARDPGGESRVRAGLRSGKIKP